MIKFTRWLNINVVFDNEFPVIVDTSWICSCLSFAWLSEIAHVVYRFFSFLNSTKNENVKHFVRGKIYIEFLRKNERIIERSSSLLLKKWKFRIKWKWNVYFPSKLAVCFPKLIECWQTMFRVACAIYSNDPVKHSVNGWRRSIRLPTYESRAVMLAIIH